MYMYMYVYIYIYNSPRNHQDFDSHMGENLQTKHDKAFTANKVYNML